MKKQISSIRAIFGGGLRQDMDVMRRMLEGYAARIEGISSETRAMEERLSERLEFTRAMEERLSERLEFTRAMEERLSERLEFTRAETMFELRAKLPGGTMPSVPGGASTAPVVGRIIATDKVRAQQEAGALRLNLGCGHVPLDGYVNADMRELPGVDAVAEVASLPFEPGSIAEIHSAHLLEHFPLEHLRRVVLPHWQHMLCPGGVLRAVTPDAEAMLADFAAGEMSFADLREVTYGLQEYDGDYHFNMFSRDALTHLLREAGFVEITFAFQGRKNGKCRDMEIRGVRA
jgi:predicted SAM-dependent methyltransferase